MLMSKYTWEQMANAYDELMDHHEGPKSLKVELSELEDSSYLSKKIRQEFFWELEAEKKKAIQELWVTSQWTEQEFDAELDARLSPEIYGYPKFSCAKLLSDEVEKYPPRCILEKNHDGECCGYPPRPIES